MTRIHPRIYTRGLLRRRVIKDNPLRDLSTLRPEPRQWPGALAQDSAAWASPLGSTLGAGLLGKIDIERVCVDCGVPGDDPGDPGDITAINAISIPAKAPHSNAAKLFVDFALSREGQEILGKFNRVPARPDVPPDPPNLVGGLTLYPARPEELVKNYDETVALFKKTFGR